MKIKINQFRCEILLEQCFRFHDENRFYKDSENNRQFIIVCKQLRSLFIIQNIQIVDERFPVKENSSKFIQNTLNHFENGIKQYRIIYRATFRLFFGSILF